jgi:hypothetical protein
MLGCFRTQAKTREEVCLIVVLRERKLIIVLDPHPNSQCVSLIAEKRGVGEETL